MLRGGINRQQGLYKGLEFPQIPGYLGFRDFKKPPLPPVSFYPGSGAFDPRTDPAKPGKHFYEDAGGEKYTVFRREDWIDEFGHTHDVVYYYKSGGRKPTQHNYKEKCEFMSHKDMVKCYDRDFTRSGASNRPRFKNENERI